MYSAVVQSGNVSYKYNLEELLHSLLKNIGAKTQDTASSCLLLSHSHSRFGATYTPSSSTGIYASEEIYGDYVDPTELRSTATYPENNTLHPAITSVSRRIHNEAASVLYGENRFFFWHNSKVERLKEWLDQVGSDNLRRIRKATIVLLPHDHPQLNAKQLFEVSRTFTSCLRKISTACTKLQNLNIFESADSTSVMMPTSDHILALTRMTGLQRLCLHSWNSLDAAEQFVRLLGLRETSKAKVKKFLKSEFDKPVVTYLHPRYHLLASKLEITDDATIDQAKKSWDVVKDLLKMELDT